MRVAVATTFGFAQRTSPRRVDIKGPSSTSADARTVAVVTALETLLHVLHHIEEAVPQLADERHDAIEIGVARQSRVLALRLPAGCIAADTIRQPQPVSEQFPP